MKQEYFPATGRDDPDGFIIGYYSRSKLSKTNLKRIDPIDGNASIVTDWPREVSEVA